MASRAAQIAGHLNWPQGMLAGQVAIITGSGQGIGAEAARLFANEGAKVIVSDIDGGENLPTLIAHQCSLYTSQSTTGCRQHQEIRRPGHCCPR